ncbi:hypothetical protein F4804DRAFT_316080 [Jackrogersella minutella]|nr:hypothetical protein F4804DRAFT_316080 [Jackrogersella minutella]
MDRGLMPTGKPRVQNMIVLCRLQCDSDGSAIVSNSLFESALVRTLSIDDDIFTGLDYSWLRKNYPVPSHQDVIHQVEDFLASPRPENPPRETLWVFNIGFWDIWNLAALPRKLAVRIIETQAQHIFSQIEILYEESHKNYSAAFSDYYTGMDLGPVHATGQKTLPQAPFRVFIPKPFDVSMTPGFENARFVPPPPHIKAEEMRNAAFLTRHWDKVVQEMLNEWTHLPEPEDICGEEEDLFKIIDPDLESSTQRAKIDGFYVPPARREAITYDVSSYIKELIVERQLRDADIVDCNGLGPVVKDEGYEDVTCPCIQKDKGFRDFNDITDDGTKGNSGLTVCDVPDEHLFWTEFTVNRRVVFDVGRRAAELLKRHMEMDVEWLNKAQQPLSSLRKGVKGVPLRASGFEA